MTAEQYQKWTSFFRKSPLRIHILSTINKVLTTSFYALYPLLLILLFLEGPDSASIFPVNTLFLACILIPGFAFVALSTVRKKINAPRPYEVLDIQPLLIKNTKGKSFPSRHVFSSFMIAMCWLAYNPGCGIALLVAGTGIAFMRVIGGIHWPKDVLAGALVATAFGIPLLFI